MVTKQHQLEWLANKITKWPEDMGVISVSVDNLGNPGFRAHWDKDWIDFTFEEWQQERDKIAYANKAAIIGAQRVPQAILEAYKALEDLPHASAILEAWGKGAEEFMSELSSKPEVDNSLRKRGSCPPISVPVELWFGGSFAYNCEFITRRGHNYVMWNLDADRPDCADYMNSEFRPLRTEREKAIDDMVKLMENGYMSAEMAKELAIKMYDSGYHK